jgi:hypothetical protein
VVITAQTIKKEASGDTSKCLVFEGCFDGSVTDFTGEYTASLLRDNKVLDKQNQNVNKSFKFVLRRNMNYFVKLEKQGYIPKTISVSTIMPKNIDYEELYKFKLQTNLISADLSSHFKDDDIDFPVALISYRKKCDCFDFNLEYTSKVMESMYKNILFGD